MRIKLPSQNLLVFVVRGKQKVKGLWTPQKGSFADYHELATVWVADMAKDCHCLVDGVGLGAKCYLRDVFELEPLPTHIAKTYAPIVDFSDEMLKMVDETGGSIEANIIHESSLIGIEESSWKKMPRLSWDKPSSENQHSLTTSFGLVSRPSPSY